MLNVQRQRHISSATPKEVFAVLSDPNGLTQLLPRLRKAELQNRDDDNARLTLCISIGSVFGTVCFKGTLQWVEPNQITYRVKNPLPAEICWSLPPVGNGTDVRIAASMDLKPLLGPMVHFIPQSLVEELMAQDFDQLLKDLAARFEYCPLPMHTLRPQQAFAL